MTCDYCEREMRTDSRGRCRNCGAAAAARTFTLAGTSFCDPLSNKTLTSTVPLAAFNNFLASTGARHGIIYPQETPR